MEAAGKKIKIAFVEESPQLGGAQLNVCQLLKHVDLERYDPVVICPSEGPLTHELSRIGVSLKIIPMPKLKSTSMGIGRIQFFNPFAVLYDLVILIPVVHAVRRFLKREHIHLVVTNGMIAHFYGGLAANLAGLPCVWRFEDIVRPNLLFGFARWIVRMGAAGLASMVIVPSIAVKREMFPRPEFENKVAVIYNAVDLVEFSPKTVQPILRMEYRLTGNDVAIGILSRLTRWKGHRDFIGAAKKIAEHVPNAKFFIVGSTVFENGRYEWELKRLVEDLELNQHVIFTGFRRDIPACFASLDICVLPSALPDPCPRVLLEGMAMEKPFVATNLGGVPEIIRDGETGILVSPGDTELLAEAILQLIRSKQQSIQMGKNARRRVEQEFTLEKFIREHCNCFEKLLVSPN